jgi:hypothetical protein
VRWRFPEPRGNELQEGGTDDELAAEVARQDAKHGAKFNAESAMGRVRLGVACLEDEVSEVLGAWRKERRSGQWAETREEVLQVAALAIRLVRQIDVERLTFTSGRFTLVAHEDIYVTSWDTWEEARIAWGADGLMFAPYRLVDNETGRVWHPGARYDWEDAQT